MEDLDSILILAAIIQLITLIVFFVMASNVSAIKKEMTKTLTLDQYIDKSNEEKFIGNKAKAKEWLLRAEYNLLKEKEEVRKMSSEYMLESNLSNVNKLIDKVSNLMKELESN